MKFKIMLILVPLLLLVSCDKGKINELNEQVARLQEQNQQLTEENTSIKKFIEDVTKLIESVNKDLDKIVETEIDIRKMSEDIELGKVEGEIKNKLGLIGQYILNSKEKINAIEKKLAASKKNLKGLNKLVSNLKTKLETRINKIGTLMKDVGILETDILKLTEEIKKKEQKIGDQESIIAEQNKRYYIFDKGKELKKKGVIKKEGGFLGIGRTTKVSPNLNTEHFNVIDVKTDHEINIPHKMKKLKFISPHKNDSYELTGDDNQTTLKILDPAQFWQATKCLVVVVK